MQMTILQYKWKIYNTNYTFYNTNCMLYNRNRKRSNIATFDMPYEAQTSKIKGEGCMYIERRKIVHVCDTVFFQGRKSPKYVENYKNAHNVE